MVSINHPEDMEDILAELPPEDDEADEKEDLGADPATGEEEGRDAGDDPADDEKEGPSSARVDKDTGADKGARSSDEGDRPRDSKRKEPSGGTFLLWRRRALPTAPLPPIPLACGLRVCWREAIY